MIKKPKINIHPSTKYIAPLVILILLVQVIVVFALYTYIDAQRATDEYAAEQNLYRITGEARKSVFRDTVISAPEHDVHIPELRVVIPLEPSSRDLVYQYYETFEDSPEGVVISTDHILDRPIQSFDQMICSRIAIIEVSDTVNDQGEDMQHVQAVTLQDGRILQLYGSTADEACSNQWHVDEQPEVLLGVLKQVRSY